MVWKQHLNILEKIFIADRYKNIKINSSSVTQFDFISLTLCTFMLKGGT